MSGIHFNFNQGADPLLRTAPDYSAHLAELEQAQSALEQQKQQLLQLANGREPQTPTKAQGASATPVWDEIDRITANMPPAEFQTMSEDQNYKDSLQALMEYVGAVQLQMIRPHIEKSAEGKKLLEQHLTNIKFLRKAASDSVDRKLADFEDYTKNYPHMSWEEYLKTKGGTKK